MVHGNPLSALVQRRCSQVRHSLHLALVLFLFTLVPSNGAFAQTGASAASTGHRLVGTVEGGVFSGAVLVDTAGEQKFYRLHDVLPDGSRLFKRFVGSAVAPAGVEIDYRVIRQDPLLWRGFPLREAQDAASSSSSFDAAIFEIDVRIDGSEKRLGNAHIVQGIAVRVPAFR